MTEAWRQMTNQPVVAQSTKGRLTNDQIWDLLSEWDRKNYVISTACFSGANGLVAGHAYTIIGVVRIRKTDGTVQRLVKARNPWGSERYKGKWCDSCKEWANDDYRKQAGLVKANDGIFHIPVEEFNTDFTYLQHIPWNDNWKTSTAKPANIAQKSINNVELVVTERKFMIQCDQNFPRLMPAGCARPNTSAYYKIDDANGRGMGMAWCSGGTNNKSWDLAPGTYTLRMHNNSRTSGHKGNYSLTTYSTNSLNTLEVKA